MKEQSHFLFKAIIKGVLPSLSVIVKSAPYIIRIFNSSVY